MKLYFDNHRDVKRINGYLSGLSEENADFKVIYRLRQMGEMFVDGSLTLEEVLESRELLNDASPKTENFIREMKCYTFYSALKGISSGKQPLSTFEQKILNELAHPSFRKSIHTKRLKRNIYKIHRFWYTRWKHPLVYDEWWFPALVTYIWSILRFEEIIKD